MTKLLQLGRDFAKELTRNNITTLASGAAFFLFLSLIPMLMIICAILPYTPISESDLFLFMDDILPNVISPWMKNLVTQLYDKSPAIISISAMITLWSASRGILAIIRGVNSVNRVHETRGFFLLRVRACAYTVLMLLSILFFLGFMVLGRVIIQITEEYLPVSLNFISFILSFRFLYAITILTFIFMLLYKWIPNKRVKLHYQLPGAVFCSIGWSLFSDGYSYYIVKSDSFGIYGSLTTIIIGLLWLYVCIYLFLLGAEINFYVIPMLKYRYRKKI